MTTCLPFSHILLYLRSFMFLPVFSSMESCIISSTLPAGSEILDSSGSKLGDVNAFYIPEINGYKSSSFDSPLILENRDFKSTCPFKLCSTHRSLIFDTATVTWKKVSIEVNSTLEIRPVLLRSNCRTVSSIFNPRFSQ